MKTRLFVAALIAWGAISCSKQSRDTDTSQPDEPSSTEETVQFSVPAAASSPRYDHPLTEADITRIFGLKTGQSVTQAVFETFLKSRVKVAAEDSSQAAKSFLNLGISTFMPDDLKRQALLDEGLSEANIVDGLSPAEYLSYLRIAFGGGRCPGDKAGSASCPAYVKDFQMSLISQSNAIFNIRYTGSNITAQNSQFKNVFTIHRESQANRQVFQFIGKALGFGGDPLRKIVLDPANATDCSTLESMLGSSSALETFMTEQMKVDKIVSAVTSRQWASVVQEVTNGVTYTYGIGPFLAGNVCSREATTLGKCYEADVALATTLQRTIPGIMTKTNFSCKEIANTVNILTSMPSVEPIDFTKTPTPPFDSSSPSLSADELFDFFIALGNGLINRADAPFADTLPAADVTRLVESGVPNAEYEMTSKTNLYFVKRFVGR